MRRRDMSANDYPIKESERRHFVQGLGKRGRELSQGTSLSMHFFSASASFEVLAEEISLHN